MTTSKHNTRQTTIPFDPDARDYPLKYSDAQIAINMVLTLKQKIDEERRYWKTFATICGFLVVILACVHFWNEGLRNDALMGSRKVPDRSVMRSYLVSENDSLKSENENLARKKTILTHGVEEFLATRKPENISASAPVDALRRALAKSRVLVTKKPL